MPSAFRSRPLLGVALLMLAGSALADSWVRPELKVVVSSDGAAMARVTPGWRGADSHASAVVYRYDAAGDRYERKVSYPLGNRIAPVVVLLTGNGELVTLDEWAGMGHGTVLAVYAADGTLRFTRTLSQLLGEKSASEAPASVSSIWWRCLKPALSLDDGRVVITTYDEGELQVALATGQADYKPGQGSCQ